MSKGKLVGIIVGIVVLLLAAAMVVLYMVKQNEKVVENADREVTLISSGLTTYKINNNLQLPDDLSAWYESMNISGVETDYAPVETTDTALKNVEADTLYISKGYVCADDGTVVEGQETDVAFRVKAGSGVACES